MNNNKIIISHCPNFYKINSFSFYEEDYISAKLLELYRKYVFSVNINDEEDINLLEKIDYVLNKYIDDYLFRKQMQKDVLNIRVKASGNFIKSTIEAIINSYEAYEAGYTRNIYFARWI